MSIVERPAATEQGRGALQAPPVTGLEAGVVEDARARQRRQRAAGAVAVLGAVLAGAIALGVWGSGAGGAARRQVGGPTRPLTGPRPGLTHLRLIVSDTPPLILDVDSGALQTVRGVVPGGRPRSRGRNVGEVTAAGGGAFALVDDGCVHTRCVTGYEIGADGSVRRVASGWDVMAAARPGTAWVLTRAGAGRCTLALMPGERFTLKGLPCGHMAGANRAGLMIVDGTRSLLVDPLTRRVRRLAVPAGDWVVVLGGELALEDNGEAQVAGSVGELTLVNLATGARRRLAFPPQPAPRNANHVNPFPSMPIPVGANAFGLQNVAVEPHGPLVALSFADTWYPPGQAAYVWVLDTRTAKLTLVPGFPAQQAIKVSGIEWTGDGRLLVASIDVVDIDSVDGGRERAVLGIWKPGQETIDVRPIPITGVQAYTSFVPLGR